jgi:quinol monooxygenase YgiN
MLRLRIHMKFEPQSCDEAASVLKSLVGPVRAEPGCTATRVQQETDGSCGLAWVEEWRTADDFEQHLRRPTFRQLLAVMELSGEQPAVEIDNVSSRRGFELVEEILGQRAWEYPGQNTA